jgi:hypothetical protein
VEEFKNFTLAGFCWTLWLTLVVVAGDPTQVGEWLAKIDQSRNDSMENYWCQVHICDEEIND